MKDEIHARNQMYKLTLNDRCGNLCKKIHENYEGLHIKLNLRSGSVYLDKNGYKYIFNNYINVVMELGELVIKSIINNPYDHVFNHEDLFAVLLVDKYTYGNLYNVNMEERRALSEVVCK